MAPGEMEHIVLPKRLLERAGDGKLTIKSVNFSDWTSNICVNANVYAIVLVSGVIIASILFVAGGIKAFANKK